MKKLLILATTALLSTTIAGAQETIKLSSPNLKRGTTTMEALSNRKSTREYKNQALSTTDLSDLLWAAYGVNREDGRRTAPSALNLQDISLYIFMESGVYIYDHENHQLVGVAEGDHRKIAAGQQEFAATAPLIMVYISDFKKLSRTAEDRKMVIAAMDAAVISQNVSIFCASVDMGTVVRASMDSEGIVKLLNLDSTYVPIMNNVVGYKK